MKYPLAFISAFLGLVCLVQLAEEYSREHIGESVLLAGLVGVCLASAILFSVVLPDKKRPAKKYYYYIREDYL